MNSLIVGNGINIEFGGNENTNKEILLRSVRLCKEESFPRHIIINEPELLVQMLDLLFSEVDHILNNEYDIFAITTFEKESLEGFKKRYCNYPNLEKTDIGFEDYYLIFDLVCHKIKLVNPEKYHSRESFKCFFIHSIYNHGKVNNIYKNYTDGCDHFFKQFDNIFTTNYDKNIETFSGKSVYYLHGAFHIKKDIYNPLSMRNQLSDKPIDNCVIDDNYYYLYSNILTDYSGFSKLFSINMGSDANIAMEKMAKGYIKNDIIRKDVDSWAFSNNEVIKKLYESIILKIADSELRFDENYPIHEFQNIEGKVDIVGLSPFNDTHIFDKIDQNEKVEEVIYYFYDSKEISTVKELLTNRIIKFKDVRELWDSLK